MSIGRDSYAHPVFAVALTLLASLGCASGSETDTGTVTLSADAKAAVGTYVLSQGGVAGALPIATGTTTLNCARFIDSGSLQLAANATYAFSLAMRGVCPAPGGGSNTVLDTVQEMGTWSVTGASLVLVHGNGSTITESATALTATSIQTTVQFEWAGAVPATVLVLRR